MDVATIIGMLHLLVEAAHALILYHAVFGQRGSVRRPLIRHRDLILASSKHISIHEILESDATPPLL